MTERMGNGPAGAWTSGATYESYMGRWSRLVAREFIAWLAIPPGSVWLEVGCGTGAMTEAVLSAAAPARIEALDSSAAYVEYVRGNIRDPRATFGVADARSLPQADGSVEVAVSGLVLNFVPRPEQAVAEMTRVVGARGVVAAYVWDYAEGMQFMRHFWDAAAALDPAAAELDEARRFPICRPDSLEALLRGAGLREVASRALEVPTRFRDFDDYWSPFLGGQGPAPTYAMHLDEQRRGLLRDRLRDRLPAAPDGSIGLVARAWAVRGVRT
jgi:trans-aconitate methyltransferase